MNTKSATKAFISKSIQKYKDRFDYSETEYINTKCKIKLRCIKHDVWFEIKPLQHLIKSAGCEECVKEAMRIPLYEILERAKILFKDQYDYSLITTDSYQ